jgi:hypothetical protein
MGKKSVIEKTTDCPFRQNIGDAYFCNHPSMKWRYCWWLVNDIPDGCPLTEKDIRNIKIRKIIDR